MTRTYSALLRGDRLEWTGETPAAGDADHPVSVTIVIEEPPTLDETERWKKALEALKRIRERGTLAALIPDPVAWQGEIRKDRPLLGREDE